MRQSGQDSPTYTEARKVLAEMARITRSGGRLVAYERIGGTFTIWSKDRQVTAHAGGLLVRQLQEWLDRAVISTSTFAPEIFCPRLMSDQNGTLGAKPHLRHYDDQGP